MTPAALVQSFLMAFVARLSGLRAVAGRCAHLLQTENFASLSHALRRPSARAFVARLVGLLEAPHSPAAQALVAIDGMAVTLPKTQRHRCAKYNDKTVGGGVVWAYTVQAARGLCPVQVLKVVEGAWHDSRVMRTVALIARGPIYLMDRGFYALELLQQWLERKVHFIVRVKERHLLYDVVRTVGPPRRVGGVRVERDAVVRLGGLLAKAHPVVRLVVAVRPSGERLVLATDLLDWTAEAILAAYKKRWHIERFHRFLKETLGLAHLYSFEQSGIMFLLYTALLLALLLFLGADRPAGEVIHILRAMLRAVRQLLGLGTLWKRNTFTPRRAKNSTKPEGKNH